MAPCGNPPHAISGALRCERPRFRPSLLVAFGLGLPAACGGAELIQKEGLVEVTKTGNPPQPAPVGLNLVVRDRLGTGEASRAVLKMTAGWNARVDEETFIEITSTGIAALDRDMMRLERGQAFIYSRESKGEWKIHTPAGVGTGRGTQLLIRVAADGSTFFQVLEGELDFANPHGGVSLQGGEAGEASPTTAPRKTAVIEARNLLQWALYYPVVLIPDEVGLSAAEQQRVAASLEAYRAGDVLGALALYPKALTAGSPAERLYHAAVLLATGRVNDARAAIASVPGTHAGRRALERMLAAVLTSGPPEPFSITTASEALSESFYQQSRHDLEAARSAARRSTELAPQSGFTWTRRAELEFSFGRAAAARAALDRALALSPRHAEAHALLGFVLSAENRIREARTAFERAIALDSALANGWLGLGLTKIKQGELAAGRTDLQTAVTVEPTRAFLYSYHAKAVTLEDADLAVKDLALAKQLDPQDPTPWLYSALNEQQAGRYNAAITELQQSLQRNDRRQVYRSRFLLDEDRAVRSSNLATIYQHNGMTDVAVREATRAVESDYANASAHLFLANSFDALRDPQEITLRYETAWFNEQLLAQLLAPVGGGPLSQFISQHEYSKLFESDRMGAVLWGEVRSDGTRQAQTSAFATFGRVSAGLDFKYRRDPGTRENNDNTLKELSGQVKYQVSSADLVYGLIKGRNQKTGDLLQNYANRPGNPELRFEEKQEPGLLLAGWNRRWGPGVHTLLLGGRLAGEQELHAPGFVPALLVRDARALQPDFLRVTPNDTVDYAAPELRDAAVPPVMSRGDGSLLLSADFLRLIAPVLRRAPITSVDFFTDRRGLLSTRRELEFYSLELQQLWQRPRHTLVAGGRWQSGTIDTHARIDLANPALVSFTTSPAVLQGGSNDFRRRSVYAYDFFTINRTFTLLAGASWDALRRPENFRLPPISDREQEQERLNGKVGFTALLPSSIRVRGVYAESFGGVSFDESVRLEPVQLAGFNQAFRTVISESLAGSVEAPVYKDAGLTVDGTLATRTWWSASYTDLREDVTRSVGVLDVIAAPVFPRGRAILPGQTAERLHYRERVGTASVHQLLGNEFAVGATYRCTRADLRDRFPEIAEVLNPYANDYNRATLEELALNVNWNASSGWFARIDANAYSQDLHGTAGDQVKLSPAGDRFWHFHLQLGRRLQRHRHEISAGVLNLTNRDYQLSPLTYLRELPRERTLFVRCRFAF